MAEEIKDTIQDKIDATPELAGKVTVSTNGAKLVFSVADGGTLSFTGDDTDFGSPAVKFKNVSGYAETLTGGNIIKELAEDTTIKITLTDKDGNVVKDADGNELKDIAVAVPGSGSDDTSRTRAEAINTVLADTELNGLVSASVDALGNVTLSSVVGHIDLNSTDTADISAVLGTPTQVSQKNQTVESLLTVNAATENNASILFEVTSVGSDTVTVKATSNVLTTDGTVKNYVKDNIILRTGDGKDNLVNLGELLGEDEAKFQLALGDAVNASSFSSGNKFVYNVVGAGSGSNAADMSVTVEATQDPDWPNNWGDNWTDANGAVRGDWVSERLTYNLDSDAVSNKELHFRNFFLNSENGTVYEGNVVLTTTEDFTLGGTQFVPTTLTTTIKLGTAADDKAISLEIDGAEVAVYTTVAADDTSDEAVAENVRKAIQDAIDSGTLENVTVARSDADLTITSSRGKKIELKSDDGTNYSVGGTAGTSVSVDASESITRSGNISTGDTLASFNAAYIGKTATGDTKLRDLSAFWNSQGVFMLETPQTITITQGDGSSTSVTVYATDTLNDLRLKLNNAIGNGLGQAQYASGNTDKFCTFVEKTPGVDMPANGLETVAGTFIFRSLIPGAAGKLTFSGDQDVINAFAMNVVTEPKESSFTASIYDAHTGQAIATNVKVTDNNLVGVLHPNVDIEFDPMANVTAIWSESQSNFITTSETKPYEAVIHLVDSSTVFQVGANQGEDLALDIGDMTAGSLGITKVNVATREAATKAIGQLDAAINKVSAQRAKIGAYQNSLEYTIENLQTTATNLTAAESRIRDADMAQTMMEFVKLQILNQSGTSMLAQANQLPQQVLSLLQ
ncbi:MAG: hypothetical protein IJ702_01915 [Fretibacterium sp.]|nr:hypothetical protein [Fretibacterium sp.]